MNRYKAEETRKRRETRAGLTEGEVKQLDQEEAIEEQINELARKIHAERYPEEWDFMFDDNVDYASRRSGINPMCNAYIQKTNQKRAQEGVTPLSDIGLPVDETSWKTACAEAEAVIRGRKQF